MTQNITTIRSSPNDAAATMLLDATDDSETTDESGKASHQKLTDQSGVEVVCGPVEMAKYVDLSGTQGVVPLTSMKLMKVKSKSFLLRFKSKLIRSEKSAATSDKPTQVNISAQSESLILAAICCCQLAFVLLKYIAPTISEDILRDLERHIS